jgi:uncharacterized repeat protein (TIGR03803 family)
MKPHNKNLFLLSVPITGLGLMLVGPVAAQTFTTLYSFTAAPGADSYANSDGGYPLAGLVLSSSTLYGTTLRGGSSGKGTVFKVNTDGTGFTVLHAFSEGLRAYTNVYGEAYYTNSDGAYPYGGLILSGNTLYGTAGEGSSGGNGTVFKVNTDGTEFTTLHSFTASVLDSDTNSPIYYSYTNSDGAGPLAGLILSGDTLYGTANEGGSYRYGTVFAVNTDGTGFSNLHSFNYSRDGAWPSGGLLSSGNTLYGTTAEGGSAGGDGTVFRINTNGTGFITLHSFTPLVETMNSDGGGLTAGLILSGNTLYGTANGGGSYGEGTLFKLRTDGTGFTTLHSFTIPSLNSSGVYVNSDGYNPSAGLLLSGNTLYGTASGGSFGSGTLFAINTNGTGFTTVYSFTASSRDPSYILTNSDGGDPKASLISSGNTLYGTAAAGGSGGNGTVFSLSLPIAPPQLTLIPSAANLILTWPTNATGFTLQSTTNLGSLAVWTTNSPAPVVVNGQNTVTNPILGTQQFFRLTSP